MKIFVCFIKQACLLAIISKFFWGGSVILWLSFGLSPQKLAASMGGTGEKGPKMY
jgi:hypothetical protein